MGKHKKLTDAQRIRAFGLLQGALKDGKLPHGELTKIAKIFGVTRVTISNLWKKGTRANGGRSVALIRSPNILRSSNVGGRRSKYDIEEVRAHVKSVPLRLRKCVRDLAAQVGLPKSTLQDFIKSKKNGFRKHSSALKPMLTETNKYERVLWALSKVDASGERYRNMEDEIHVDEKWFYLTRDNEKYILLDEEDDPVRSVKHKSHIDKVMFLAATAKPRWDPGKNQYFDGKLGIWPFAHQVAAQRSSANRPAGTLEWKTFNVNREEYKKMLIEKVLPAIKEKWPRGTLNQPKFIQQDNAPLHIKSDDPDFAAKAASLGLNISLINQPPNSPDTNINDLAFFVSIQSLQHKIGAGTNKGTLIASVNQAFEQYPWQKLRDSFLTLQTCLNSIIEHHGGNDYKIQHMSKARLEKEGRLPSTLEVTDAFHQFMLVENDENAEENQQ